MESSIDEEGVSLEELSQSYRRAVGQATDVVPSAVEAATVGGADGIAGLASELQSGDVLHPFDRIDPEEADQEDIAGCPLTPQSILEAILFVGRSDGSPITAAEIADLMRGVQESEVVESIDQLNEIYAATNRATRIVASGAGFRLQLADDLSSIRNRFYGRVRQVKLNQAAIDCLALISYQPGISREELEQQRGQPSGSLLSQLIRRQLVEMCRETAENSPGDKMPAVKIPADKKPAVKTPADKKTVQRYYPTQRLLDLAGIESLDDLPQTEDID
ncbi:MAG: SMC-Scp complex subunit ScpB [Pirellulaceae bacterium]|nr:SMC-Scp complex subunit ScpB [Pirellulaceae bacterium]